MSTFPAANSLYARTSHQVSAEDPGLRAQVTALTQQVTALTQAMTGLLATVEELREAKPRRRLYDYDEAAAELRVHPKWLKNRIKTLPRVKAGRDVFFTDDDLDQILARLHVSPERASAVRTGGAAPPSKLTPLPGRRAG